MKLFLPLFFHLLVHLGVHFQNGKTYMYAVDSCADIMQYLLMLHQLLASIDDFSAGIVQLTVRFGHLTLFPEQGTFQVNVEFKWVEKGSESLPWVSEPACEPWAILGWNRWTLDSKNYTCVRYLCRGSWFACRAFPWNSDARLHRK